MSFLIDGYNLLHAMGILRGRVGPTGLRKARLGLLGRLQGALGTRAAEVTVVFDAAHGPPDRPDHEEYGGVQVRYARDEEAADALIETLISQAAAPRRLTIVSDDHRIRDAARRRGCPVLGCADFLEWLERQRQRANRPEPPAKPEHLSAEETERWLREFADLEQDPGLRELSDPGEWLNSADEE
jgi:predicted RNA-binding protein with PIN domain